MACCIRCLIPTLSFFLLVIVGGGAALPYFAIVNNDNLHVERAYNWTLFLILIAILGLFVLLTSFAGFCTCCCGSKPCFCTLGTFSMLSLLAAAVWIVIMFVFTSPLVNADEFWANWIQKENLEEVVGVENGLICCGYEYPRTEIDIARCAAYLNPDFIKRWLNGSVPFCKQALIDHFYPFRLYVTIAAAAAVLVSLLITIFSCSMLCSSESNNQISAAGDPVNLRDSLL